jgi:hypothetical protein
MGPMGTHIYAPPAAAAAPRKGLNFDSMLRFEHHNLAPA